MSTSAALLILLIRWGTTTAATPAVVDLRVGSPPRLDSLEQDDLAPTGIKVYEHVDYAGVSAHMKADVRDLSLCSGGCRASCSSAQYGSTRHWGDGISSIKLAPGWKATVYVNWEFGGGSEELTADLPSLGQIAGPCKGNWNGQLERLATSAATSTLTRERNDGE